MMCRVEWSNPDISWEDVNGGCVGFSEFSLTSADIYSW